MRTNLCLRMKLSNVLVFSDCLEAVKALLQSDYVIGTIGVVALDVRQCSRVHRSYLLGTRV